MSIEKTLVLIKPDATRRHLIGPVLAKLDEAKLKMLECRLMSVSEKLARAHYAAHEGKDFFNQLIEYITGKMHGAPVLAIVYEGENAIQRIRALAGNTNPEKADVDTIRGMFGRITTAGVFENVVHASANPEEAAQEVKLWF
jgi:nucleoside-diphosphate kinase